jgi:hypothetical protein
LLELCFAQFFARWVKCPLCRELKANFARRFTATGVQLNSGVYRVIGELIPFVASVAVAYELETLQLFFFTNNQCIASIPGQ